MNSTITKISTRVAVTAAALCLALPVAKAADMPGNTTPSNPSNQPYVAPGASGVPVPPGNASQQRIEEAQKQANTSTAGNTTVLANRDECVKDINDAAAFYSSLQQKPSTSISATALAGAKAVVFIDRWAASAVIGGTSGRAIVFKRGTDGKFNGPAFYDVAGGSIGAQVGVSHVKTLALLMTDKALRTLEDNKFIWSGNLRAVGGNKSASDSTVDNNADVFLYQTASGLDAGATVAATRLVVDEERNRKFYNQAPITVQEIFAGKVTVAPEAKELIATLSKPLSASSTTAAK